MQTLICLYLRHLRIRRLLLQQHDHLLQAAVDLCQLRARFAIIRITRRQRRQPRRHEDKQYDKRYLSHGLCSDLLNAVEQSLRAMRGHDL
jgi:hypothetical protein